MNKKYVSCFVVLGLVVSILPLFVYTVEATATNITTSTSDGHIYAMSSTYTTAHNSLSGTVVDSGATFSIGQRGTATFPTNYYIYRGFVFFDTSAIPSDVTIDSAWLNLTGSNDFSTVDFNLVIQNGQPNRPNDPLQTSDYGYTLYSGDGGSVSSAYYPNFNIEMNADGRSWINKGGSTKLALISSEDIISSQPGLGAEYVDVHSRDGSAVLCPWLNITYTLPSPSVNVEVTLNIPLSGTGYASETLPADLNLTVNETLGRNMTINIYGDDIIVDTHLTDGNETYEYPWTPSSGGIHTWDAIVNCSEGLAYGVWSDVDATDYCSYTTGTTSFMGIINVEMNDGELDHASGYSNTPYEDFTFTGCNISLGNTYELSVTLGGIYVQALAVWVDWNNDSVLDADERTVGDSTGSGSGTVITAQITVSNNAVTNGSVLMRVITDYQSTPEDNPCGSDNYGDCEDYSIKVLSNVYTESETRWFAVDYFNDTFNVSDYINDSNDVTVNTGNISFTKSSNFERSITLGSDDATENPTGYGTAYFASTTQYLYTGYFSVTYQKMTGAYRFQDMVIPQGATGISAFLDLYIYTNDGDVDTNVTGVLETDTPTWLTANRPWSRPSTSVDSMINWSMASGGVDTWRTSPDLGGIIEEIVGQGGWTSGNSLGLLVRGNDTDGEYKPRSFEYSSASYAPKLTITYYEPTLVGNITSVNISRPDNYMWDTLSVHTNQSDNFHCNFSILDSYENVLLSGLDGMNNSLSSIGTSEKTIRLFGEFNDAMTMFSWNISWISKEVTSRIWIRGDTRLLGCNIGGN